MIDVDDLRFFETICAAKSLAAAARDLNVSPPAVTQRLRSLEARLGVQLIDRAGRALVLTTEGETLVERGRDILEQVEDLDRSLAERRNEVAGKLRVVAPFGFGRRYVAPVAAAFQAEHPKVTVDLILSDQLGGVPAGKWDLAVQVGEMANMASALNVRRLADNQRFICASPAYLTRFGEPTAPEGLEGHACIVLRENFEDVTLWRFQRPNGGPEVRMRINPGLSSNDGEVIRKWAVEGRGIIMRSEWDVAPDLRAGRLVRLLSGYALADAPVVVLLSSQRYARASRITGFIDALAAFLCPPPWRNA